ncbi:MAG TPA: hypothetical protein PK668_21630 [Myxococcota bacterium]|nr:hypothetical protein [Myxococcota bacterium]HRY96080.1 hypothetical protein [Myxococcota bacterium]HSA22624.1 hypothetical protein [Myxococcota bacterium]
MSEHVEALRPFFGKIAIVQVLADAEAFCFDWDALPGKKRQELLEHHFAAVDQAMRKMKGAGWLEKFQPFALLGHSIPSSITKRIEFSAPHEGLLFVHKEHGPILYCAAKDDPRLAMMHESVEALRPVESCWDDLFDAKKLDFSEEVDRSECEGFTLGEIETMMEVAGGNTMFVCGAEEPE